MNFSTINQDTVNKIIVTLAIATVTGGGIYIVNKTRLDLLHEKVIRTAQKYLGQKEIPPNMSFVDKSFLAKMKTVGFIENIDMQWCSMFVKLVFTESFFGNTKYYEKLKTLITPSTQTTYLNFKNDTSNLFKVSQTPSRGAMVIWQKKSNHSRGHIGIVVRHNPLFFLTIEGNANNDIIKDLTDYRKLKKNKDYKWEQEKSDGSVQYCIRDYEDTKTMTLLGFISLK